MQILYLFCQSVLCLADWMEQSSALIGYDLSTFCNCHFSGRYAARVYRIESMAPQEREAVSPVPRVKLWRTVHVDVC
jgi:lysine/ornithine N-monooxygenase